MEMDIEHPEWLPVGWKVTVKARPSTGKKDRYYINLSNGRTLNSKPRVLEYLKTHGKDRKTTEIKDPSTKSKETCKVGIEKTIDENLPPGWIKEIRSKMKHGKIRRDRYYIDPNSGRKFRSMREVFCYLESWDPRKAKSKAKAKQDDAKLKDHSQSLPAEAKGQRLMNKKTDRNLIRHKSIKSGSSSSKTAATSVNISEGIHLEQSEEDDSLASLFLDNPKLMNRVKRQAYRLRRGDKKLGKDRSDKSLGKHQSLKSDAPKATKVAKQKVKDVDSVLTNLVHRPPLVKGKEQCYHKRRHSKRLANIKQNDDVNNGQSVQSGSEDVPEKVLKHVEDENNSAGLEDTTDKIGNMPETVYSIHIEDEKNSAGIQLNKKPAGQTERKFSKRKLVSDFPRRSSNRLARMEIDPSKKMKTSRVGLASEPEFNLKENFSRDHDLKRNQENPVKDFSGELKSVDSDCKEHKTNEKHLESTLKDLLMDPCIEFAVKTLTGVIPIENLGKASSNSPVSSLASPNQTPTSSSKLPPTGGIWADPCFEFAVKTLTGDMPVQDSSQLQITLQQPFGSSLRSRFNNAAVPKFGADNVYSLNHPSTQFDAVKRRLV